MMECEYCGYLFENEQALEEHLRETYGIILKVIEELDAERCQEPPKSEYPYYPYYVQGKDFICEQHKFSTPDTKAFLDHLLKNHPQEEVMDWLRNVIKQKILHTLRVEHASNELVTDEDLARWTEKELQEFLMTNELTRGSNAEAFTHFVDQRFEKLKTFLSGTTSLCPECHRDANGIEESYPIAEILSSLKGGMQLSGKEKGYLDYVKRKYPSKWVGEKLDLCLRNTLHLFLSHRGTFDSLIREGVLPFNEGLTEWLRTERWKDKTQKLSLETLMKDGLQSPQERNSTESDKKLKKWLSQRD
jgi:hypothetical protein